MKLTHLFSGIFSDDTRKSEVIYVTHYIFLLDITVLWSQLKGPKGFLWRRKEGKKVPVKEPNTLND